MEHQSTRPRRATVPLPDDATRTATATVAVRPVLPGRHRVPSAARGTITNETGRHALASDADPPAARAGTGAPPGTGRAGPAATAASATTAVAPRPAPDRSTPPPRLPAPRTSSPLPGPQLPTQRTSSPRPTAPAPRNAPPAQRNPGPTGPAPRSAGPTGPAPRNAAQTRRGAAPPARRTAPHPTSTPPTTALPTAPAARTTALPTVPPPVRVDRRDRPRQRTQAAPRPTAPRPTDRPRIEQATVTVVPRTSLPPTTYVVALVPAHNEEEGIAATVASLLAQERAPDRVVVVADNCTDRTVELAEAAGADVFTTEGNTHRKAGALNAALETLLPNLRDTDVVLAMDADSTLMSDFVANGLRYLEDTPERGAISGSYRARDDDTVVGLMQRLEYAQGLHIVHARGGRIHVLSGAACMFSVGALREVADRRGSDLLPGRKGLVYLPESLTEDYELTVALKRLGYEPLNARECEVETDVMGTWAAWRTQRLRWQRGTLETLFAYGWIRQTRSAWAIQVWTYFRSLVPLLMVLYWAYALAFETLTVQPFWLIVLPVFMLDQLVASWRAGPRARLAAVTLLPMWLYDAAQSFVYWRALLLSLRRGRTEWIT